MSQSQRGMARAVPQIPQRKLLSVAIACTFAAAGTMLVAASTLPAASGHLRGGAAHPPALATALVHTLTFILSCLEADERGAPAICNYLESWDLQVSDVSDLPLG